MSNQTSATMTEADETLAVLLAEGFTLKGSDFLVGPESPAVYYGERVMVRTCYELTEGRWEGFASMRKLNESERLAALVSDLQSEA